MSTARTSRALGRTLRHYTRPACPRRTVPNSVAARRLPIDLQSRHVKLAPASVRYFSIYPSLRKEDPNITSGITAPTQYVFEDIKELSANPSQNRILIDVREPGELLQTGRIPTAKSVPVSSAPDAFFMSEEDFAMKFGFPRPGEQDEVIFYCKAGVRSKTASLLAGQATPNFGGKIGNYAGSWLDWEKNGGPVEKEGQQGDNSSVTGTTNPGQGAPPAPRP